MRVRYLFVLLCAFCIHESYAQISVTSTTTATQAFSIGTSATASLPANWKMSGAGLGATANWADAANVTATTHQASSGSPVDGGRYNWGDGTTDRAVGFMTTANYVSPNSIMAYYRNTSGNNLGGLKVAFEIERYRTNTSTFSLAFYYSFDGVTWIPETQGDIPTSFFATGNSAYDYSNPTSNSKNFIITGLNIPNNGDFYLRWVFTNTGSANSMGLGLDDVAVTGVLENPNLPISCPYDFIFVLDESNSIAGTGGTGATNISGAMRTAAKDLMAALNGTGTRVAVVEFRTTAARAVIGGSTAYQVVDAAYIASFNTYMGTANDANTTQNTDRYDPEDGTNYTNWEAGLNLVNTINTNEGVADLVIFLTDGNPTAYTNPDGVSTTQDVSDPVIIAQALLEATIAANTVKVAGSHIFAMAIPNPTVTETNLHQIAGTGRYPDLDTNFVSGDYTISSSQTLRDDLQRVAENVCKVDLSLAKASQQSACAGDTITFTLQVTNSGLDNDTNVVVTDVIPAGFTYVSDSGGAATTYANGTLTWNLATLAGGGFSNSLQIQVIMNPTGSHTNIASVIGTQTDIDTTNNDASFTVNLSLNCDDGDACTNDFCDGGVCAHSPVVCDDESACTDDACVNGTCVFTCNRVPLAIEWQRALGGTGADSLRAMQQTADGGYILAGATTSNNGNVTGNHGGNDFWVVKTDAARNIVWQKALGGTGHDYANDVQQTSDGGYIVAGYTYSSNGDVTGQHGASDVWVVKLDAAGTITWQKALGGTGRESAYSVRQTVDGGYIVTGFSNTANGDITTNQGTNDLWIVKLTATGTITWQKSYGGNLNDTGYSVQQTADGGYIVAGGSNSTTGDVTGNHGTSFDCWILKLDATGNITWKKMLGGTGAEEAYSVRQTTDGGYIVAGYAASNDGDVTGNQGGLDSWVFKLDGSGNLIWQNSMGGDGTDIGAKVLLTADGGCLIAGFTNSSNDDVTDNNGGFDTWVTKLNASGNLIWQKTLGGTGDEVGQGVIQVQDGGIVVASWASSNNGDVSGNNGSTDFWLAKLLAPCTEICNGEDDNCNGETDEGVSTQCDDQDPCTTDACSVLGVCVNTPVVCNDNDGCTADVCVNGVCQSTAIVCNDQNACTDDACAETGLINGSFETPDIPASPGNVVFFAPNSGISGWQVSAGDVDIVDNAFWSAFDGSQSLDLAGGSLGTIEQTFATTAGLTYQFSFRYANNPLETGSHTARVEVVGSSVLFADTISHTTSTLGNMDYHLFSGSFTANSAQSTIRFRQLVVPINSAGIALDAVSVTGGVCQFTSNPVVASIAPPTVAICPEQVTTLTASGSGGSGGYTFAWNTGEATAAITVGTASPTHTVTVTDSRGCADTEVRTITLLPAPTAAITPQTATVCRGSSTTLTASGGVAYVWSTGATTPAITVSPTTNTTYTVTVTNAEGCHGVASRLVTVSETPTANINPATAAVCLGQSTTLTATGGGTYLWSTGATTAAITVSPITNTTYTVTVTNNLSCTATATRAVTVNPVPTAAINPTVVAICPGSSATLTASGGGTYLWSTGATTAAITVSPVANTTYTVTVTDANSCSATASRTVTLQQALVPTILPADVAICNGQSTTLTASGGSTYAWSTGANTPSITVSPTTNTTYTVTVTTDQGCSGTASRLVTVSPLPTAGITPPIAAICLGNSATLTASGGTTYAWSTGATTAAITVSPATTTTYTVTVTDAQRCSATASRIVTVNTPPVAVITPPAPQVCAGANFTLTAGGGTTYLWSTGATTAAITTSIQTATTFTVTVTDGNQCSDTASVLVALVTCNDNNLCTSDACVNSACVFTPIVCNDQNACTTDGCNPQTGCTTTTVNCDDQNACTSDACLPTTGCINSTIICNDQSLCTTDACSTATGCVFTTVNCDDGDACTVDNCTAQAGCTYTVLNCNDNNACSTDDCDTLTGCTYLGVLCNDNNACTNDICNTTIGCTYPVISCNDQNPCTTDGCNTVRGCVHGTTNCNDQNACTTDGCDVSTGCTHVQVVCNDNSLCTRDSCTPALGCIFIPVNCNDNDPCTVDACDALTGCSNTPLPCADTDLCTTDKCIDGLCVHIPVDCNDGDPCTNDACVGGNCQFVAIVCNDDDLCTDDFCLGGNCVFQPVSCDDQNACTQDVCVNDVCQNNNILGCCLSDAECNDNNACNTDICNGFRCYHVATCCTDENPCTYDFCLNGICVTTPSICDDSDPCTQNLCLDGICSYPPIDCSDGNACTNDSCASGGICLHTPLNCNDQNPCTTDFCDTTGTCQHLPVVCDDANFCTTDSCIQGECIYTQIICNDLNLCTDDFCVDGDCVYLPVDCDDQDVCTNDNCSNGTCLHPAVNCNDNDACTLDSCGVNGCFYTLISCTDNDLCTVDFCVVTCQHVPQDCSDGNGCTFDICVDGLCQFPPITCDDNIECTIDACVNGNCTSTPGQINVAIQKTDMSCGCLSQNQLCLLNFAGLPAGTILAEQYANQGIHISAQANSPGKNAAIVFDSHASGTPDPDLEVDYGNLMVIARDLVDTNPANGLVDKPNDNSTGGRITLLFDFPRVIESFDFVDEEEPGTFAFAYDVNDNLITFIAVPAAGDASIQTVPFAASGVRKLVFQIDGSGAVTNIVFGDCCCDGTATATASGGTAPYNFAWSTGATTSDIDDLCVDEYCVTVTDANGCSSTSCIDILQGGTNCDDGDSCTIDACSGLTCIHTPIPGCDVQQPCVAEITDYTLVYESTLGDIAPLTEGMVIDRDEFCRFNIRANYCGTAISSVKFVLNGNLFRIEQDVPYALAGDNPTGDYHVWTPQPNNYTLTATPYSGPSATGTAGISLTIHFTVIDNTPQDNENCNLPPVVDCNGDVNGTAFIDACGVCAWGNTGVIPNSQCPCDAEVNITVEQLPELCQGGRVLLKAVTAGAISYAWSTGESAPQIFGTADNVYSVTTTDINNCVASDTTTTPPASAILASYVVLAQQSITLDKNKVFIGALGATGATGSVTLNNGTQLTTPNTFVRAANIILNSGSAATTQYPVPVNLSLPAFETNIAVGGAAVNVPANSVITLGSSFYGGVQIDSNSTVTFSHGLIDIDSLVTGKNVTILFTSQCVKLRVKGRVVLGVNNAVNADSSAEMKIYAEGDVIVGSRSNVLSDIFTQGNLTTHNGIATDYTTMIGFFIADNVVGGQFTAWYWDPICGCMGSGGPRGDTKMSGFTEIPVVEQEDKVLVRAYPNPFSERLNLEFSLPADAKAKLDIFSSNGKKIATLFDGQVKAAELRKVEYRPTTIANGLVLYRLQTSSGVYYGKAVMVK